jgi:urease accessory protein
MAPLLRLLHLASPALPTGAFAHSQGMEPAVEAGWVHDEGSAGEWIVGVLRHGLGCLEIPALARLHAGWLASDGAAVQRWNDLVIACRGSRELAEEDRRIGGALARALVALGLDEAAPWTDDPRSTYVNLFALGAARFEIPLPSAAAALLFAWCENQAAAAMRLVPLGQTAGLRLVAGAAAIIPGVVDRGLALPDEEIGFGAPALAIASALHETQYSRLFRS